MSSSMVGFRDEFVATALSRYWPDSVLRLDPLMKGCAAFLGSNHGAGFEKSSHLGIVTAQSHRL
jgi:hypothetical protein